MDKDVGCEEICSDWKTVNAMDVCVLWLEDLAGRARRAGTKRLALSLTGINGYMHTQLARGCGGTLHLGLAVGLRPVLHAVLVSSFSS